MYHHNQCGEGQQIMHSPIIEISRAWDYKEKDQESQPSKEWTTQEMSHIFSNVLIGLNELITCATSNHLLQQKSSPISRITSRAKEG